MGAGVPQTGRPGLESLQTQRTFPVAFVSRLALRPTQPPIQWVWGSFPGGKARPGRDADHSPPSSEEVKNEYVLYLFCHLTPAWWYRGSFTFLYFTRL
jgi:hypothetical protein